MKIGIITFHASYNCGSILQCRALVQLLKQRGHNVQVINYSNIGQQQVYSVFLPNNSLRNIVKNILSLGGRAQIEDHCTQYQNYIDTNLPLSGDVISDHAGLKDLQKYDAIIAGGDQVWNVSIADFDTAYFLDFAKNTYKFSFSPSLGARNINEDENHAQYRDLLLQFDDISCREVNGQKWLEQLTGREVQLVADPTLLLPKEVWKGLTEFNAKLPERFIFYYAFAYSPENNAAVERIAKHYDIPVIVIDAKQWYIRRLMKYPHFILLNQTGPNAFLQLMDKATYVLTTSFHGTIFSLNFGKQFLYIETKNHDIKDDRTSFILKQMGLSDRYLRPDQIQSEALEKPIDRQSVLKELENLRTTANEYLDLNLARAEEGLSK